MKFIANFGTGINHIDLAVTEAAGITVTRTPGALTEETADLTGSRVPPPNQPTPWQACTRKDR